ncbi:MAG: GNAT family N-acetyltransferase [Ruminiclostridium sp.]|nr:GNAT family N-acetyltransferase [Ruminiclostridium sp.]
MKELETRRLKLRYLKADDAQTMFDGWTSDPEVPKYMTWYAHTDISQTESILAEWLAQYGKPDCYRWGIELKESRTLIGMIDVVGFTDGIPEVGYCSAKRCWGNGYMTEALGAVKEELFADGYDTIIVEAVNENIGSNRVIQKCGGVLVSSAVRSHSGMKPEPVLINTYRIERKNL